MKTNKKLIVSFILLLSFIASCCAIVFPNNHPIKQEKIQFYNTNQTNIKLHSWLANIDDENYINKINIPGSHDTAATFVALSYKTKCQNLTTPDQLNTGIRYLDVRLNDSKEKMFLCHGPISCLKPDRTTYYYEDLLKECKSFLKKHPSEFIILNIKNEKMKNSILSFDTKIMQETNNILNNNQIFISDTVPKVRDVRGKIVIYKRYFTSTTMQGHLNWQNQSDSKINVELYNRSISDKLMAFSQDQYKLSKQDKTIAINQFLNSANLPSNGFRLCFFSNSGQTLSSPKDFIECFAYNQNNYELLQKNKGFILVYDFCNTEKSNYIIQTNF